MITLFKKKVSPAQNKETLVIEISSNKYLIKGCHAFDYLYSASTDGNTTLFEKKDVTGWSELAKFKKPKVISEFPNLAKAYQNIYQSNEKYLEEKHPGLATRIPDQFFNQGIRRIVYDR